MSNAWEVTIDDLSTVLNTHGIHVNQKRLEEIFELLDYDSIEDGVLYYTDFDDQVASGLADIEAQLAVLGIIPLGIELYPQPKG